MYGIVIDDQAEPALIEPNRDAIIRMYDYAKLLTATAQTAYKIALVVADPECAWCEDQLPGWWEIDADGEFIEPPLHDGCRSGYADQEHAGLYV